MSKLIARVVVGLALLYVGGATAFAYSHYDGAKPDVPTILKDFHGWMGSLLATKTNPPKPPAGEPPPAEVPAAPATPRVAPPAPSDTPDGSAEDRELRRIQDDVLPAASEKARALRGMSRSDAAAFEKARVEVLAMLGDARTFLNGVLEKDADHQQANKLWNRLQGIYTAVKHL
jgi:type IV secretory pathway VirB10-like protein